MRKCHEKELVELSARSSQQVEKSYYARLGNVAKALADGLIDQAEHNRTLNTIRSKRADAITMEIKRRVESDEQQRRNMSSSSGDSELKHKRKAFVQKIFGNFQNMKNVKVRIAKLGQVQNMLLEKKDDLSQAYDLTPERLKILVDKLNKKFGSRGAECAMLGR
jgi:hypothetical protein